MKGSRKATQPQLALDEPIRNRSLFADHFLEERLPHLPQWQQIDGLDETFDAIKNLYQKRAPTFTEATNEDQTENDFIQPALDVLWGENEPGDCYQVEVSIPNLDAHRQPDYALFRTAAERQEAQPQVGTLDYWQTAPCLGDAKKWAASLDKKRGYDENPSAQIVNYLYRSRTRWGILTNGRIWRLYEQDRSRTGGVYYEVNLEAILQSNDREAFKHFFMFFRRESFLPDQESKTFLDHVFEGSVQYATEVGDSLKESVYDALRLLMNGFCEHSGNGLDAAEPATLESVHENSLIVLYRLLFVLFAEDRDLLPCEDANYEDYSLRKLQREINDKLRGHGHYLPQMTNLWGQLCNLFRLIDEGFEPNGQVIIPAYNGGLFSPEKHPHVAHTPQEGFSRWEVGDHRLSQVIDMLAYQREHWDQPGTRDIDYATLAVQHLGSIYEGLLELRPQVAQEVLVETSEKGKPVFKPESEVANPKKIRGQSPRTIAPGEVYLVTDRGERKATGSYYTPTYIVQYIVEHTVGPLADEAAKKVAELVGPTILSGKTPMPDKSVGPTKGRAARAYDDLLEPYLSLHILDPAMGSGHFLVGAADFLSLAMATDPNLPEPADLGDEEPQTYYKRLIVERCLYGVDLNPLAVELAKLSLWLHTVSRNKALSFLDHHLRCGNSLIGARIEDDLMTEPPQFNKKGKALKVERAQLVMGFTEALTGRHLQYFLDSFRKIMEAPSGTAEGEREKDRLYREMEKVRERFRAVANSWLAPYFDAPVTAERYQEAVTALKGTEADWRQLQQRDWFQAAQSVGGDKGHRFFHWELEFPECFFDMRRKKADWKAKQERGFDAVIGNPPYGLQTGGPQTGYLRGRYASSSYNLDSFAHILENSVTRLARTAFSMIVPNTWLTTSDGRQLRELILRQTTVDSILDTGNVFDDAIVDTLVLVLEIRPFEQPAGHRISVRRANTPGTPEDRLGRIAERNWVTHSVPQEVFRANPEQQMDIFLGLRERSIVQAVVQLSAPLVTSCEVARGCRPYGRGEGDPPQTDELIRAKAYHAQVPVDSTYHPLLTASEVHRYIHERHRQWLSHGPWLAVAGQWRFFSQERILVQRVIRLRPPGLIATCLAQTALNNTDVLNMIPRDGSPALGYILALLNSRLMGWYCQRTNANLERAAFPKINCADAERLPIRLVDFPNPTPPSDKDHLLASSSEALEAADYDLPLRLAEQALATHAALHGPAGKAELREDPYWTAQIEKADLDFPGREDFVHDLLADLAQRMMDMNRQKHEETQGFLAWLQRHIKADIEDLSNKTKIKAYHEHDLDTLLGILAKNRKKLGKEGGPTGLSGLREGEERPTGVSGLREGVNPKGREFQEQVAREFEASVAKLGPLKERLERTDRLIDQIVYKLYGLTDEEIAIVEGAGGASGDQREDPAD